jgi:carbonic anhydrase/acetyltransferase-like protein (isoleucine patch superfamily)
LTQVVAGDQFVDLCLVNSSRRNDAAFLLRSGMKQSRTECTPYFVGDSEGEYVNLLRHEADLRQLASDALHHNCQMAPAGTEIRPGIWAATDSQIDKRARLVAPIFIGSRARICPGAVITRGSSIERHTVIGNKTVVENGTVLPYTNLGPGLDVSHSLVGERHICNLQRNVCTPIKDPRLVSQVPASAGVRTLFSMAKSFARIPGRIWRGLEGKAPEPAAESTVSYKQVFDSAKTKPVEMPKVSAGLAVARRYGNQ